MSEKFSLKWNDYSSNWSRSLSQLRKETDFADVTLVTDDKVKFSAHKILLSSCSNTFKFILKENTRSHTNPLIYLSGVSSVNLGFILDYIYNGEVNLYQEQLDSFLETSEKLEIEGLLCGKKEETIQENLYPEDNFQIKEQSATENSIAPAKTRRQVTRTRTYDEEKIDVTSMTPDEVEIEIEKLYKRTDGVWSCSTCGFTNRDKSKLKRHVEVHVDGLSYTCNFCQKEFGLKNSLDCHIIKFHR